MFLFIIKTGVLNVWRQKVRYGGAALCIFLFTVALLTAAELSGAVNFRLEETGAAISEIEYETTVTGSGSWEALQSGDVIQNISNPLLIAGVCIRLLLVFLWLGAFILVFAILYMILTERMQELHLCRLLGFSKAAVFKLLLVESVVLSGVSGSISYAAGRMILYALRPQILDFLVVPAGSIINAGGTLAQYLLVYLAAEVGASVWFMIKTADEI